MQSLSSSLKASFLSCRTRTQPPGPFLPFRRLWRGAWTAQQGSRHFAKCPRNVFCSSFPCNVDGPCASFTLITLTFLRVQSHYSQLIFAACSHRFICFSLESSIFQHCVEGQISFLTPGISLKFKSGRRPQKQQLDQTGEQRAPAYMAPSDASVPRWGGPHCHQLGQK